MSNPFRDRSNVNNVSGKQEYTIVQSNQFGFSNGSSVQNPMFAYQNVTNQLGFTQPGTMNYQGNSQINTTAQQFGQAVDQINNEKFQQSVARKEFMMKRQCQTSYQPNEQQQQQYSQMNQNQLHSQQQQHPLQYVSQSVLYNPQQMQQQQQPPFMQPQQQFSDQRQQSFQQYQQQQPQFQQNQPPSMQLQQQPSQQIPMQRHYGDQQQQQEMTCLNQSENFRSSLPNHPSSSFYQYASAQSSNQNGWEKFDSEVQGGRIRQNSFDSIYNKNVMNQNIHNMNISSNVQSNQGSHYQNVQSFAFDKQQAQVNGQNSNRMTYDHPGDSHIQFRENFNAQEKSQIKQNDTAIQRQEAKPSISQAATHGMLQMQLSEQDYLISRQNDPSMPNIMNQQHSTQAPIGSQSQFQNQSHFQSQPQSQNQPRFQTQAQFQTQLHSQNKPQYENQPPFQYQQSTPQFQNQPYPSNRVPVGLQPLENGSMRLVFENSEKLKQQQSQNIPLAGNSVNQFDSQQYATNTPTVYSTMGNQVSFSSNIPPNQIMNFNPGPLTSNVIRDGNQAVISSSMNQNSTGSYALSGRELRSSQITGFERAVVPESIYQRHPYSHSGLFPSPTRMPVHQDLANKLNDLSLESQSSKEIPNRMVLKDPPRNETNFHDQSFVSEQQAQRFIAPGHSTTSPLNVRVPGGVYSPRVPFERELNRPWSYPDRNQVELLKDNQRFSNSSTVDYIGGYNRAQRSNSVESTDTSKDDQSAYQTMQQPQLDTMHSSMMYQHPSNVIYSKSQDLYGRQRSSSYNANSQQLNNPVVTSGHPIVIMPGFAQSSITSQGQPPKAFESRTESILQHISNKQGPMYEKLKKVLVDLFSIQDEVMEFKGRRGTLLLLLNC